MPLPMGYNADAKFIGSAADFYEASQGAGAVTLIDDNKREHTAELRRLNPTMIINNRRHYADWEGQWELCPYNNKPPTAQRQYDILTADYHPQYNEWINFGNEPKQYGANLKYAIDFYCETAVKLIANKVPTVYRNIYASDHTMADLPLYIPLLKLIVDNPKYCMLGTHIYFMLLLFEGVGTGKWSNLLNFGNVPYDKEKWASPQKYFEDYAKAHIGRDHMYTTTSAGVPNVLWTECFFDRIENIAEAQLLDNANDGVKTRGIGTLSRLLKKHAPNLEFEDAVMEQIEWLSGVTPSYVKGMNFYNWSIEPAWADYNIAPFSKLWRKIAKYNQSLGAPTTPPPALTWAQKIQQTIDDHEARLKRLEGK